MAVHMCGDSHITGTGADIHVGSLREYIEYEVRGRAHNIRGTSDWSKPIRVLTRRKAIDGGCDNGLYKWTQTRGEVVIQLVVGTHGSYAIMSMPVVVDPNWQNLHI